MKVNSLSRVWLFVTPWTVAHQALPSMGFSRQEWPLYLHSSRVGCRGPECKCRKSKIPGVTGTFDLGVQNEAGQRLTEFCQDNVFVIANILFQQHKRRPYIWTSPDGQNWNQIHYILCSQSREALYSQQKQDQELTVAQIINSLLPNSGKGYPLHYSVLENSIDFIVHGVWKSWARLSNFYFTSFHFDVKVWKGYY